MANSVDLDETARSGSTLLAKISVLECRDEIVMINTVSIFL